MLVFAGGLAIVGTQTLVAALRGVASDWPGAGFILLVMGVSGLTALAHAVVPGLRDASLVRANVGWVPSALILCDPSVVGLFVAPVLLRYGSHDTTPWSEAISGVMIAAVGLLLLGSAAWQSARSYARPAREPEPATQSA